VKPGIAAAVLERFVAKDFIDGAKPDAAKNHGVRDIESEVQDELAQKYEARMKGMLEQANQDAWTRLYEVLSAMSDRLTVEETEEGPKKKVFRDSLVTNAEEICGLLTSLNVAGDPALERARARLEDTLNGVTADDLRKSDGQRVITKQKVDAILSDFDWFQEEEEV
jgi:hypothetical protein